MAEHSTTTANGLLTANSDGVAILATIEYLPLTDLLTLRVVCRTTRSLVTTALRLRWHRTLRRFLDDPLRFRTLLRTTQSVVSGSVVLFYALANTHFADGWRPDDMDIYCPLVAAVPLLDYLVQHEKYTVHGRHVNTPYGSAPTSRAQSPASSATSVRNRASKYAHNSGIAAVIHLARADGTNVDLVCSARPSALAPLPSFWSTLVLNYASADALCVVYPHLTLRGRACLNPRFATRARTARCVEKYTARGFSVRGFGEEREGCALELTRRMSCPHTKRAFGDGGCLILPMEERAEGTDGARVEGLTQVVSWRYGGSICGGGCRVSSSGFVVVEPAGSRPP